MTKGRWSRCGRTAQDLQGILRVFSLIPEMMLARIKFAWSMTFGGLDGATLRGQRLNRRRPSFPQSESHRRSLRRCASVRRTARVRHREVRGHGSRTLHARSAGFRCRGYGPDDENLLCSSRRLHLNDYRDDVRRLCVDWRLDAWWAEAFVVSSHLRRERSGQDGSFDPGRDGFIRCARGCWALHPSD